MAIFTKRTSLSPSLGTSPSPDPTFTTQIHLPHPAAYFIPLSANNNSKSRLPRFTIASPFAPPSLAPQPPCMWMRSVVRPRVYWTRHPCAAKATMLKGWTISLGGVLVPSGMISSTAWWSTCCVVGPSVRREHRLLAQTLPGGARGRINRITGKHLLPEKNVVEHVWFLSVHVTLARL
jgi:hypothetical protein